MLRHLFAVHHLMIKEEKHSLLTLGLRLGQLGQLPRKDEIRAPAEDIFTLHGSKYTHTYTNTHGCYLILSLVAVALNSMM